MNKFVEPTGTTADYWSVNVTKRSCIADLIRERFRSEQKTAIITSDSTHLICDKCNKAIWLDAGEVRMVGEPTEVVAQYTEAQATAAATGKT